MKRTLYVVESMEVEEGEVRDGPGTADEVWLYRRGRIGRRYNLRDTYESLDDAVAYARALRERHIKGLLRQVERLALNPNIKVRLLKTEIHRKGKENG